MSEPTYLLLKKQYQEILKHPRNQLQHGGKIVNVNMNSVQADVIIVDDGNLLFQKDKATNKNKTIVIDNREYDTYDYKGDFEYINKYIKKEENEWDEKIGFSNICQEYPKNITCKKYPIQLFIDEQKNDFEKANTEISKGIKKSHWMWYIFPQIIIEGTSSTSQEYAIKSLGHARQYLDNEYLLINLIEINKTLGIHLNEKKGLVYIMGNIDAIKYLSSATLFAFASCLLYENLYKVLINNLKLIRNNPINRLTIKFFKNVPNVPNFFDDGLDVTTIGILEAQKTYNFESLKKKVLNDVQQSDYKNDQKIVLYDAAVLLYNQIYEKGKVTEESVLTVSYKNKKLPNNLPRVKIMDNESTEATLNRIFIEHLGIKYPTKLKFKIYFYANIDSNTKIETITLIYYANTSNQLEHFNEKMIENVYYAPVRKLQIIPPHTTPDINIDENARKSILGVHNLITNKNMPVQNVQYEPLSSIPSSSFKHSGVGNASILLINNSDVKEEKVLMVQLKNSKEWTLPGGKLNKYKYINGVNIFEPEDEWEGAIREFKEETREIIPLPFEKFNHFDYHGHTRIYYAKTPEFYCGLSKNNSLRDIKPDKSLGKSSNETSAIAYLPMSYILNRTIGYPVKKYIHNSVKEMKDKGLI